MMTVLGQPGIPKRGRSLQAQATSGSGRLSGQQGGHGSGGIWSPVCTQYPSRWLAWPWLQETRWPGAAKRLTTRGPSSSVCPGRDSVGLGRLPHDRPSSVFREAGVMAPSPPLYREQPEGGASWFPDEGGPGPNSAPRGPRAPLDSATCQPSGSPSQHLGLEAASVDSTGHFPEMCMLGPGALSNCGGSGAPMVP